MGCLSTVERYEVKKMDRMKQASFSRCALGALVAGAILSACGASQPPVVSLGATSQSRTIIQRDAKGRTLIYVTSADLISAYTTSGKLVSNLQMGGIKGLCSDYKGNVFIPSGSLIYEYAHGGTQPIATLNAPAGFSSAYGCAVDPMTGNLAVTFFSYEFGKAGNVAIYQHATGTPQTFSDSDILFYVYCGYDNAGNLFVDGAKTAHGNGVLAELPQGGNTLSTISLNKTIGTPSAVQWDGQEMAIGDSYAHVVYQLSISGSQGTVVGTTTFKGWNKGHNIVQFWIWGDCILIPFTAHHKPVSLGTWAYPAGGSTTNKFPLQFGEPSGVTLSVAPM
jgi:hypothetical protein